MLSKAAGGFEKNVGGNVKVLLKNGLDKEFWGTFREMLEEAGS